MPSNMTHGFDLLFFGDYRLFHQVESSLIVKWHERAVRVKGMKGVPRYVCLILLLSVMVASILYVRPVAAQSSQITYTVKLSYLSVQLSYPSQVMPGDNVTVYLQASAKNRINSVALSLQIFYSDGNSLHQLAWTTVSNNNYNYMNSGSSLSKQIQFTIPQDAPRTRSLSKMPPSLT